MTPHCDTAREPDKVEMVDEWCKIRFFCQQPQGLVCLSVAAGSLISRDDNQSRSKDSVLYMQSSHHVAGFLSVHRAEGRK